MKKFSTYQNRKNLFEQLPLKTPLSIHVCVSSYCNFKCHYCVHSISQGDYLENGMKKEFMDIRLFEQLVHQIKGFDNKLKLFNFAYLGEPLLHKDIVRMVDIAVRNQIAEKVEIVSNASMLSHKTSDGLVKAGLTRLRISIQGTTEKDYLNISKYKIDYSKLVDEVAYLYKISRGTNTQIYIKAVDAVLDTDEKKQVFMEMFGDICDHINIEQLIPILDKCDISDMKVEFQNGYFGNEIKSTNICSQTFYLMIVLPNGEVIPCCTMGKAPVILSNIEKQTIKEIWNGDEIWKLRKNMLMYGFEYYETCKGCGVPLYQTSNEDYLDSYITDLLEKYRII